MTPPQELVRAVSEYDKDLKIRWAPRTGLWHIGKPLPPGLMGVEPKPRQSNRGLDVNDTWRAGLYHVMSIHPLLATNAPLIKSELARCDAWAQGGMKKLADALDAEDEKQEKSVQRDIENDVEAMTSEFIDHLGVLNGNRIFITDPKLERPGEQRDGYVVHDRRHHAHAE